MKVVVAHYSGPKIFRTITLFGAILLAGVWLVFFSFHGAFIERTLVQGGIWLPDLAVGLAGLAYGIWIELLFIYQALFDQKRALWIEDDALVFLSKLYFKRKCGDVEGLSFGKAGRSKKRAIILRMRKGADKVIPTGAFQEPEFEVVDRLAKEIHAATGHDVRRSLD